MSQHFDVEYFKNLLRTTWIGSEFVYIEKINSTNTYLKDLPFSELIHGMVVLTDYQFDGRGQYEKKWEAAPFKNLTFTIGFKPPDGSRLPLLTLGCACAISKVLERYTGQRVHIKWPNDLLIGGKKIGGLLTESKICGSKPERVLIGIGINIFQKRFRKELDGIALSLDSVSRFPVSREKILSECLLEIEQSYRQWHKMDVDLQRSINERLIGYGDWVWLRIYENLQKEKYKFIGVSENGELLMLNQQLDVNKFSYEQIRIITGDQGISETDKSLSA